MPWDEADRRLQAKAVRLVDESCALSYALSMMLAATPCEVLSREEIDALCQLAYELHAKLTRALELFKDLNE